MKCCVKNCFNKYRKDKKNKFFGFPNEKKLQKKWFDFCGTKSPRSGKINSSWKVCEIHFQYDDFIGKYQCDLGIARKLLLKPGAVPSVSNADFNENLGERGRRLADRKRRSLVESLLKDVPDLPDTKIDNTEEYTTVAYTIVELDEAEASNAVTISNSEDEGAQQDSKVNDSQAQIILLENKLKLLEAENDQLIKIVRTNELSYKLTLRKKNYEIEQLNLALCKTEEHCTKMKAQLRAIFTEAEVLKVQREDK